MFPLCSILPPLIAIVTATAPASMPPCLTPPPAAIDHPHVFVCKPPSLHTTHHKH